MRGVWHPAVAFTYIHSLLWWYWALSSKSWLFFEYCTVRYNRQTMVVATKDPGLQKRLLESRGTLSLLKKRLEGAAATTATANKSIVPYHTSAATHNSAEESAMHH